MEAKRTEPAQRNCRNMQSRAKQITSVMAKKSVSVAAMFRKQPQRPNRPALTSQPAVDLRKSVLEDGSDEKAQSLKSRSSSRGLHRVARKVSQKRSNMHSLAVAFKSAYIFSKDVQVHRADVLTMQIRAMITAITSTKEVR
jgi:hypothetical protein